MRGWWHCGWTVGWHGYMLISMCPYSTTHGGVPATAGPLGFGAYPMFVISVYGRLFALLGGCMCGYCACTYHGPSSAPSTPARAPPTPPAAFLRTGFHSVTVRWFAVGMALCVTTLLLPIGFDKPFPLDLTSPHGRVPCHGFDSSFPLDLTSTHGRVPCLAHALDSHHLTPSHWIPIGFAPADGCHGYAVPLPAC